MAEEMGYRSNITLCLGGLGHSAAAMGDVVSAKRYFQRALSEAMGIGSLSGELYALVGFARLKALAVEPVRAAEWLGLIMAHPSSETDVLQRANALLTTLREALAADELEAALARGKSLELQAVVDELTAEGAAQ